MSSLNTFVLGLDEQNLGPLHDLPLAPSIASTSCSQLDAFEGEQPVGR